MLASPLYPAPPPFSSQHTSDESVQYRPSKDLDSFNKLLPPPIEFVEGSSSGALAVAEGKYEPINTTPKAKLDHHVQPPRPPSVTKPLAATNRSTAQNRASLYPHEIEMSWPQSCNIGCGLYNTGNTCFLNSALQCLLHTPPLLRVLISHETKTCLLRSNFCMCCNLRQVLIRSHGGNTKNPISAHLISDKLQVIAKHMRRGRQEDSHEFLRYAIDALQKSCLAGHPPKLDPKLAETTWVHKIFGGRLRSRVTCKDCGHNSDTFDSILDISLDIHNVSDLKGALRKFVAIDYLRGADKYKCEKCKKHVVAAKQFTLHDAPSVLTIHLKRFSPLGRKIGHHVDYSDYLLLQPYMSDGQHGPSYSLYGVICHAGGGPNSGHYFAYVQSRDNRWWEMNDESVTLARGVPVGTKNAYILFYQRNKERDGAVKPVLMDSPALPAGGVAAAMRKRMREGGEDEDKGVKVVRPFIGPRMPSPPANGADAKRPTPSSHDRQAEAIKKKIEATATNKAQQVLQGLDSYASDSDGEPEKEGVKESVSSLTTMRPLPPLRLPGASSSLSPSPPTPDAKEAVSPLAAMRPPPPPGPPALSSSPSSALTPSALTPSSFYGTPAMNDKKRKHSENDSDSPDTLHKNNKLGPSLNPYSRLSTKRYGGKRRGRPRPV